MKIRDRAIAKLGGKCQKCGSLKNLQLHHVVYAEDSPRWYERGEYWKRAKEAFEHPERFELVCKDCHSKEHKDDFTIQMFAKMKMTPERRKKFKKWRRGELIEDNKEKNFRVNRRMYRIGDAWKLQLRDKSGNWKFADAS